VSRTCRSSQSTRKTIIQAAESLLLKQSLGKPSGELQVFCFIAENILCELDDLSIVGDFAVTLVMPGGG